MDRAMVPVVQEEGATAAKRDVSVVGRTDGTVFTFTMGPGVSGSGTVLGG